MGSKLQQIIYNGKFKGLHMHVTTMCIIAALQETTLLFVPLLPLQHSLEVWFLPFDAHSEHTISGDQFQI